MDAVVGRPAYATIQYGGWVEAQFHRLCGRMLYAEGGCATVYAFDCLDIDGRWLRMIVGEECFASGCAEVIGVIRQQPRPVELHCPHGFQMMFHQPS